MPHIRLRSDFQRCGTNPSPLRIYKKMGVLMNQLLSQDRFRVIALIALPFVALGVFVACNVGPIVVREVVHKVIGALLAR